MPLANACGALVGDVLYVAGGIESPDATKALDRVWTLNLSGANANWQESEPFPPGGFMLAMAGTHDGAFYMAGGVGLIAEKGTVARRYHKGSWRYWPGKGWSLLDDLPYPLAAAPSAGRMIFGGDAVTQINVAPADHRGFTRCVLQYDPYEVGANAWYDVSVLPAGHVTAPVVWWNDSYAIISGEIRPGVRSPKVLRFTPSKDAAR